MRLSSPNPPRRAVCATRCFPCTHPCKHGPILATPAQTLAKVMDLVNSVQRAQAPPPADRNAAREQQLWDRQSEMYERLLQQWDAERTVR